LGGSTSWAGQTRDFGVDHLKQHKIAPGWDGPGPDRNAQPGRSDRQRRRHEVAQR
jgi:hypothetical protein